MTLASLDTNKIYSYADYLKWQFDERVELIKGKIFKMSPAPNTNHQIICGNLFSAMHVYLSGKECKVFMAPFDVRLSRKKDDDKNVLTVVQPDICVICDPAKIDTKGCLGAPDIVVEILSPANNSKELKNKYEVYEQAGVKEYWIISPQDYTFLMYTLTDGVYVPSRLMVEGDVVQSGVLPGFTLNLSTLFSEMI